MRKIKDVVHDCYNCDIYPCTEREIITSDLCKACVGYCCKGVVLTLLPCEEKHLDKLRCHTAEDFDRLISDWCPYFNKDDKKCIIYDFRPIICRIATCGIIERAKPVELRILL